MGKFECDICGKGLSGKSYLLSHRRQAHKLDADGNAIEEQVVKKVQGNKSDEGTKERRTRRGVESLLVAEVNGKWKCRQCDKGKTDKR